MSTLYTMVAPCFFGTESTLNFEVKRLGAQNIQVTDGRVAFQGGADVIAAANLNLRTAERVLLLLATYKATTFDELFDGCYNIAWEDLLPANAAFPVKLEPVQPAVQRARLPEHRQKGHRQAPDARPQGRHPARGRRTVQGALCPAQGHRGNLPRHLRRRPAQARLPQKRDAGPIKETLAAAIADLGRVRRDSLVQDPFCGSGTLVIEAAQKALNLAPGLRRRFAAEHFDFVPADIWAEQRQKALDEVRKDAAFEGIGYDIDPAAVALANANAKLAGVGDRCRFEVADVREFRALDNATVLTNPPYGERLGDASEAASLARTLGQVWQAHPAQGLYAITADAEFEQHFGKKAARRRKIYNGMIRVSSICTLSSPSARGSKRWKT